jgi:cytochrome c oxidase subunit 2
VLIHALAFAEYGVNMTEGVTSVSRDIYGLHMMVFWVSVAIAIIGILTPCVCAIHCISRVL